MKVETGWISERTKQALRQGGMSDAVSSLSMVTPIISPMGRATDWICLRVETNEASLFLKLASPDAASFVTVRDAAAGARAAAALGIAPEVRFALEDAGAMAVDLLPPVWREARLSDLSIPHILQAVLTAKRRMHLGPALDREWDVFAEIEILAAKLSKPPEDVATLLEAMRQVHRALENAGQDRVACHADGMASNIMIGPRDEVRLVDFDCAGMADPDYDIGVVLNEVCALDADWAMAGAMAYPEDTLRHVNRCRVYAVADDLLWGLWGLSTHDRSSRMDLEFLKYGYWRLLRCRTALRQPGHINRLRHL